VANKARDKGGGGVRVHHGFFVVVGLTSALFCNPEDVEKREGASVKICKEIEA